MTCEAEELAVDGAHALVQPAEGAHVVLEEWLQPDDVVVHARDQLAPAEMYLGAVSIWRQLGAGSLCKEQPWPTCVESATAW